MRYYKAVTSTNIEEFNVLCNELAKIGWSPVGGVSTVLGPAGNYIRYTQAFMS